MHPNKTHFVSFLRQLFPDKIYQFIHQAIRCDNPRFYWVSAYATRLLTLPPAGWLSPADGSGFQMNKQNGHPQVSVQTSGITTLSGD
jgi:hypothetical protein